MSVIPPDTMIVTLTVGDLEQIIQQALTAYQPSPVSDADDRVLDVESLAAYLKVSTDAVYALVNQNPPPFPVARIGKRIIAHQSAVRHWLLRGESVSTSTVPLHVRHALRGTEAPEVAGLSKEAG